MINQDMQEKITNLVGIGLTDREILEYVKKKSELENMTTDEVMEAIRNAKVSLKACAKVDDQLERGKALWRLADLFKKSMMIQDYKGCLAIQKEIDELMLIIRKPSRAEDLL